MLKLFLNLILIFNQSNHEYICVDSKTKELLTGVKIETTNQLQYSDFDGKIKLNKSDSIQTIQYFQYNLQKIENDSIFLEILL